MAWSIWWLSMSNKFNQTIQIFAAGNFSNEIVQTLDILMQYSVHSTPSRFILRVCTARNIFHGKRLKHNTKKKVIRLSWKPALPAAVRGNFSPPPRPVQSWQHTLHRPTKWTLMINTANKLWALMQQTKSSNIRLCNGSRSIIKWTCHCQFRGHGH